MAQANLETVPLEYFRAVTESSAVPLYAQIADALAEAVHEGALTPGSRLESEVALGRRLGRSYVTIRHAVNLLIDRGMMVRRRGVGTIVVLGHEDTEVRPPGSNANTTSAESALSADQR